MDIERFEQLVSRWLDEPQREDLRRQIEQHCAHAPDLRSVYEAWMRLDALIRASGRDVGAAVDWPRFRARVLACCAAELPDGDFERFLRDSTRLDAAIDWSRLRERIVDAARRPEAAPDRDVAARREPARVSRPALRWQAAVALLATAAAVALVVLPRLQTRFGSAGRPPGGTPAWRPHLARSAFGRGVVELRIGPPPADRRFAAASQAVVAAEDEQTPEFYMMIDSPRAVSEAGHRLSPFGFQ